MLLADESAWERASFALRNFDNDHQESRSYGGSKAEDGEKSEASDESREDDITASILLSAIFNLSPEQTEALLRWLFMRVLAENDELSDSFQLQ